MAQLGDDKTVSREARKESRSLGIFKRVSKASESPVTSPPASSTIADKSLNTLTVPLDTNAKLLEKTTTTTATYYPGLSRQDSLIARKDSAITASTITRDEHAPSKDTFTSAALTSVAKSGFESESGDELGEWKSPKSVALKPYSHQVGGHSALFKFSRHAVCKPLIEKENAFYQDIEINRQECTPPPWQQF